MLASEVAAYHLRRGGSVRIVQKGNRGDGVRDVQKKLVALGYDVGDIDGDFGRRTEAAVRQFQEDHGLRLIDGRVGPETIGALKAATIPLPRPRTEPPKTTAGIAAPEISSANDGERFLRDVFAAAPSSPSLPIDPGLRRALARGGVREAPPVSARFDPRFSDPAIWGPPDPAVADIWGAMQQRVNPAMLQSEEAPTASAAAPKPPDFEKAAAPSLPRPVGSSLPQGLDASIVQHNADVGLRRALEAKAQGVRDSAIRFDPAAPTAGLLSSPVAGRTDRLPIAVPKNSYVVPADVVSGLGQGNTEAGAGILDAIFGPHAAGGMKRGGAPSEPQKDRVPIIAAGGEYVVDPAAVQSVGRRDFASGHRILDKMVTSVRKQTADRLRTLPGPKK